jgi:large subunit ribosomal protein L49
MSLPSLIRRCHHYFVPRNGQGSLPVYTDIRNAGSRHLVLVRNVDGDATVGGTLFSSFYPPQFDGGPQALAKDLSETLFQPQSAEAARIKVSVLRSRHLVITGGRWKHQVMQWLTQKGF